MNSNYLKWIYLVVLSLIWGSSFILIKKGLVGLSPLQLGSLRIVFAALFLLMIGYKSLPLIPRYKWKFVLLTGLLGTFVPAFLFAIAQTQISSSVSSILNSLTPLNSLILGVLLFKLQYKRQQILGVIIGFIGTSLLVFNGAMHHPEQNYYYAILILVATMCYATNVNVIKIYLSDLSPLSISTGNFLLLFFPALLILFFTGFFESIQITTVQESVSYILILGLFGTGIANILFFKLIQISTPVFATSVTYLIPIVAFFWGLLDNELLTIVQFIGALIILVGVYLSSKK
ncbi:MAG TPA: DMT family transporter [Flavobacterium sp.]|jgi:drug/metabolite transporter (DMT)-like permease|nr:DMT family transporter [Flavobacterium sp.]